MPSFNYNCTKKGRKKARFSFGDQQHVDDEQGLTLF